MSLPFLGCCIAAFVALVLIAERWSIVTAGAAVLLIAVLFGCATPEDMARRQAADQARKNDYANMLIGRCLSEGFRTENEDLFLGCVKRQHAECERRKNQAQADYYSNLGTASSRPGSTFLGAMGAAGRNTDTSGLCR